MMSSQRMLLPLLFLILPNLLPLVQSQSSCLNNGNYTTNSTYKANLDVLLSYVSINLDSNGFYNSYVGQNPDRVNAIVLCRGDIQLDTCWECLQDSTAELIKSCPNKKQAINWQMDLCMLRYSNETLVGDLATDPGWYVWNTQDVTSPDQFKQDLRTLLDSLRRQAAYGRFLRKVAAGNITGPDFQIIYGLVQCTPDLSPDDCNSCLIGAAVEIPTCCDGKQGGRVLRPSCTLRFEIYPFYNGTRLQELAWQPEPPVLSPPGPGGEGGNKTRNIIIIAVAIAVSVTLAACAAIYLSKRIKRKPHELLEDELAIDEISSTVESLQYDFGKIRAATNDFSDANKLGKGGFGIVYWGKLLTGQEIAVKRLSKNSGQGNIEFKNEVLLVARLQHRNLVRLLGFSLEGTERLLIYEFVQNASLDQFIFATDEISSVESLQFDFGKIRDATNDFSDANKLGQGGFGAVYRGKLPSGQEIAVKRLSRESGQGNLEFKNEVLLVAKLQHRNLVRLLGFSIEGTERLLIYEFVENASLDQFIFDPIKRSHLDWDRRYKIIAGIARGLVYLHEDSRLRIIHRDLKASNVLLDGDMNPKIADFGMARLVGQDETQRNTSKIVGTYGYMSPEYAMHGQFSVKSDVFSFGVLVLEIISGQRNNCFQNGESTEDLLSLTWKNWRDGTAANVIDPVLRADTGSRQDMLRCIHIGLLCVQENGANRPTMASVVLMLNSTTITLQVPSEPPFLMSTHFGPDISRFQDYDSNSSKASRLKAGISEGSSQNEVSVTDLYPR
ncbi:UNVERIFIED_CONTAM: Cysteine-rich receptor-like protein kinase [Sesamum latifolium]|uniref:Cysteine-rich receptor-like protein kinase n=1 Tax=Sesamum latifolium TaxID=2727402 RepID=A0AAW2WM58_9LAMI